MPRRPRDGVERYLRAGGYSDEPCAQAVRGEVAFEVRAPCEYLYEVGNVAAVDRALGDLALHRERAEYGTGRGRHGVEPCPNLEEQ